MWFDRQFEAGLNQATTRTGWPISAARCTASVARSVRRLSSPEHSGASWPRAELMVLAFEATAYRVIVSHLQNVAPSLNCIPQLTALSPVTQPPVTRLHAARAVKPIPGARMNFALNDEQKMMIDTVRRFIKEALRLLA